MAAEVGSISWIQGDCSKINKMKQHNLEFMGNIWDWTNESFADGLAISCEHARNGQDVFSVVYNLEVLHLFPFPLEWNPKQKSCFPSISFQNKSKVCKSELDWIVGAWMMLNQLSQTSQDCKQIFKRTFLNLAVQSFSCLF